MRKTVFWCAIFFVLLVGCAPKAVIEQPDVFFPPAPDPPRVQFLLGIGKSTDVESDEVEYSLVSMTAPPVKELKSFSKPYGVATTGAKIYVADTLLAQVAVIDLREKTFDWLKGNFGPGKLKKPINLAVDAQGNLYVADVYKKKVLVYNAEGDFVRTYGEGKDLIPVDVEVDARNVYILDRSRSKLMVFNKRTGRLVEGLGQDNDNVEDNLSLPTNMALNEQGIFYIANVGTGKILTMDRDGHFLGSIGKMGDGFGQFGRPKGVAIDKKRRLYAVDAAHQNVQMFNEDGRLLMFFGSPGLEVGSLSLPAGLAVTDQDLDFYQQYAAPDFDLELVIMVINQVDKHRIAIYGLGKKRGVDYEGYYRETERIHREEFEKQRQQQEQKSE